MPKILNPEVARIRRGLRLLRRIWNRLPVPEDFRDEGALDAWDPCQPGHPEGHAWLDALNILNCAEDSLVIRLTQLGVRL